MELTSEPLIFYDSDVKDGLVGRTNIDLNLKQ